MLCSSAPASTKQSSTPFSSTSMTSGEQTDGPVVGEGVDLVGPGDAARLVAHVAGVVPEPRDGDLRDEDLFRVAVRADHAPAAVQAAAGATTLWYTSSRMPV